MTTMTVNNTLIFRGINPRFRKRLRPGGKLVFGQELDDFEELIFDADQRFVGSIRNIELRHDFSNPEWVVGTVPIVELKVSYGRD